MPNDLDLQKAVDALIKLSAAAGVPLRTRLTIVDKLTRNGLVSQELHSTKTDNMATIANLINNPAPDVDINDVIADVQHIAPQIAPDSQKRP